MRIDARESPNAQAMPGKKRLAMSTTSASISQSTADWTQMCLQTSRRTPPSPPPTMRTSQGFACENIARCASISWYDISSRSVHIMAPSRTSTLPQCVDWKTSISCTAVCVCNNTSLTSMAMARPGQSEFFSMNQPPWMSLMLRALSSHSLLESRIQLRPIAKEASKTAAPNCRRAYAFRPMLAMMLRTIGAASARASESITYIAKFKPSVDMNSCLPM
mmetsp:Transcript_137314/g.342378  ORF Transcript_137314/g.342378 Transcript_137314/m.342378 type:complete len:219 (+) Transcript_137314:680-1336(+)